MHQVLRINELLDIIFTEVLIDSTAQEDASEESYTGLGDLARLARVCRAFREPALDVLWESIGSVTPLLNIVPRDESGELVDPKFGDNTSAPWKRYYAYANRVRYIEFDDEHESLSTPLVSSIAKVRPFGLVPRLSTLSFSASSPTSLTAASLFICHRLTDLAIQFGPTPFSIEENIQHLYRTIATHSPHLLSLRLSGPHWHPATARLAGAKMILSLTRLRHVEFDAPTLYSRHLFKVLGRLPELDSLEVDFNCAELPISPSPLPCLPNSFPKLQHLIACLSPMNVDWFLTHFPLVAVTSISIDTFGPCMNADIAFLLDGLSRITDPSRLRGLHINVSFEEEDKQYWEESTLLAPDDWVLDMRAIEPALHFTKLNCFEVQLGVPLYLTDADLCRVAQAWPGAASIELSSIVYSAVKGRTPECTLISLRHFARHCPYLIQLGVFLNILPETLPEECPLVPSQHLQSINFGPTALRECHVMHTAVAVILAEMFHGLRTLHGYRRRGLELPATNYFWRKVMIAYEYAMVTSGRTSYFHNSFFKNFPVDNQYSTLLTFLEHCEPVTEDHPERVLVEQSAYL